jgi:hypothetical protein
MDTDKTQPGSVELGKRVPNFLLETQTENGAEVGDAPDSTQFPELKQTTAPERKEKVERQATLRIIQKSSAKGISKAIDYFDTIAGPLERAFWLLLADLIRRGDWMSSILLVAVMAGLWLLKIRVGPSPLTSFIHSTTKQEIKTRLVSLGKTIYR